MHYQFRPRCRPPAAARGLFPDRPVPAHRMMHSARTQPAVAAGAPLILGGAA